MTDVARRIALVIDYSLDYLGGAQSAFLDQARLLRQRGHAVTIVAPNVTDTSMSVGALDWEARGWDLISVPARMTLPGVDLPVVRNTRALRDRLQHEFDARGIEIVHVHSEFGLAAAAISVGRRQGLVTVQTVHTFFWQVPTSRALSTLAAPVVRGFGRWLRGFPAERMPLADLPLDSALRGLTLGLARRVHTVISPSAHQAERLRDAGLERVAVIPNALAAPGMPGEPVRAVSGPLRIVWVGRLVPEKRLLEWIDAVALAAAALEPAAALDVQIIGEGPLRAEAEARVRAAGAPVEFLGRLPRAQVQQRMRDAHVIALTSFGFDNQPVTIVEALHARRAVLYVDPALTEGVDVAGIRSEGPDAESMAALLVDLVRSPERVLSASARAADGAHEFDPDVHIARLLAAYES